MTRIYNLYQFSIFENLSLSQAVSANCNCAACINGLVALFNSAVSAPGLLLGPFTFKFTTYFYGVKLPCNSKPISLRVPFSKFTQIVLPMS